MRHDRFRLVAMLVLVTGLGLAACSREAPATTPAAPVPTAAAGSATPSAGASETAAPSDEYAVPDEIDAAYVEKVLEALTVTVAEATRIIVREGRVTAEAKGVLATSHRAGEALPSVIESFERALKGGTARDLFNPNAQGIDIAVEEILSGSEECIFAEVTQDTSDLAGQEIKPTVAYYHLAVKKSGEDPERVNPTPWMIVADVGPPPKGQEYEDPCG